MQPDLPTEFPITRIPDSNIRIGAIVVQTPEEMIERGAGIAKALRDIIVKQGLFSTISGKEYVRVEGWTTLGAMMGILPKEDWIKPLEGGTGYEARVLLVRASDGVEIGAASAMVTRDEKNWENRDDYALRSMAATRATGKAFRLAFSWIMHLAGYEVTPAEEMPPIVDVAVPSGRASNMPKKNQAQGALSAEKVREFIWRLIEKDTGAEEAFSEETTEAMLAIIGAQLGGLETDSRAASLDVFEYLSGNRNPAAANHTVWRAIWRWLAITTRDGLLTIGRPQAVEEIRSIYEAYVSEKPA